MKLLPMLFCAAVVCFPMAAIAADDPSIERNKAETDYIQAKQKCFKQDIGAKRDECMNKAAAAHKKTLAQIKADALKVQNAAVEQRRKAVAEATAVQLQAKQDATAAYTAAVKKAEAEYDAKVLPK